MRSRNNADMKNFGKHNKKKLLRDLDFEKVRRKIAACKTQGN